MPSSYTLRLVCLSMAVQFLVHLAMALAVSVCAPAMMRRAERWRAQAAARMMFALRLLPAASALFVVFAICIPSYLRLEPPEMEEEIGIACLALAAMGAAVWAISMARAARAVVRSIRSVGTWRRRGVRAVVSGLPVWIIDGRGPTLALAGIFRPKLIVSRDVIDVLPADQLASALRHERAHANARDNFRRLLLLIAPGAGLLGRLDRAWARFTEWSADDRASEGDATRAVSLAAALVTVARLGPASVPPLVTSLVANAADLQIRVERLLRERDAARPEPTLWMGGCLLVAGALGAMAFHPATLSIAYGILERLID